MQNTLFFDTETTGLKKPDHKFPMPVQIGLKLDDANRNEVAAMNFMIRPDGWHVTEGAAAITGITDDVAGSYGVDIISAVDIFLDMVDNASRVVAHNLDFDMMIMDNAVKVYCKRTGHTYGDIFANKQKVCTKLAATPLVKAPPFKRGAWKWPKLDTEAYPHFFGKILEGAHDALTDVRGCADIYYKMLDMGVYE